jgi:hypothetical protein
VRIPAPRPTEPAAEERMPTQARPPAAAITAGPGAEAMPTQGVGRASHTRE